MYNEQVIYTAHLQKTETETFEELANFFETGAVKKLVKDIKTALGREQIILLSGARIKFLARTRNGGRGQRGDLLIFDEATSALDNQSEALVQEAMEKLCKGRTTIIIAHRLSTVKHADLIYCLRGGRIVEHGSHAELLAQDGYYKMLYEMHTF